MLNSVSNNRLSLVEYSFDDTKMGTPPKKGLIPSCPPNCPDCQPKPTRIKNPTIVFGEINRGAKKRKLQFEISKVRFLQITLQETCAYCGDVDIGWGLDRIDSDLHYTADNVVNCCAICNNMKNDMAVDEFIAIAVFVAEYQLYGTPTPNQNTLNLPVYHLSKRSPQSRVERFLFGLLDDHEYHTFISQPCTFCGFAPAGRFAQEYEGYRPGRENVIPVCQVCMGIKLWVTKDEFIRKCVMIYNNTSNNKPH